LHSFDDLGVHEAKLQGTYNYEGTTSSLRYYYLLPNPVWGSGTNWLLHSCMLYCNNKFTGSEYQYFTDPLWGPECNCPLCGYMLLREQLLSISDVQDPEWACTSTSRCSFNKFLVSQDPVWGPCPVAHSISACSCYNKFTCSEYWYL